MPVDRQFRFKDLAVGKKLSCIVVALVVPIVVLAYLLVSSNLELGEFAKKEVRGVEYLRPLRSLVQHVPEHRSLLSRQIAGANVDKEMAAKKREIAADLALVDEVEARFGETLAPAASWKKIKDTEQRILADAAGNPRASYELETQCLTDIIALFAQVGQNSNLLFDPELESYYLMDALYYRIPGDVDILSRLGDSAGRALDETRSLAVATKVELSALVGEHKPYAEAIDGDFSAIIATNPAEKATFDGVRAAQTQSSVAFIAALREKLLTGEGTVPLAAREIADLSEKAAQASFALFDRSAPQLQTLLEARIAKCARSTQLALASIIGGLLFTFALVFFITRIITGQVRGIESLFGEVGMGNFAARAPILSHDELGTMAASLNIMLDNTLGLILEAREKREPPGTAESGSSMKPGVDAGNGGRRATAGERKA